MIYAIILLSLALFWGFIQSLKLNSVTKKKIFIIFAFLLLILVSGLRHISIGIDTMNYFNSFMFFEQKSLQEIITNSELEKGYLLLQYFIYNIFGNFQFLLIFVAIFQMVVVAKLILKHSVNPLLSTILFIVFGFYTFGFSAIRQTLAISFVVISLSFIERRKFYSFIVTILIAASFHISALIFIPSYFIAKMKIERKNLVLLVFSAVIVFLSRNYIIQLLNQYARIPYASTETGGYLMYLFLVISVILGVIFRKQLIEKNPNNSYFMQMMIMTTILMPITMFHPAVMRLFQYFFIFMIIYIPNLLHSIKDHLLRYIAIFSYILTGLILFFGTTIEVNLLQEYLFFWL